MNAERLWDGELFIADKSVLDRATVDAVEQLRSGDPSALANLETVRTPGSHSLRSIFET
jgi:hypothetical protein